MLYVNGITGTMENKDKKPIFYANAQEMDKLLSVLIEDLRSDIAKVRGKISDIRRSYGWDDRLEHIEGGLTCMLVAMYATMQEMEKFENKNT